VHLKHSPAPYLDRFLYGHHPAFKGVARIPRVLGRRRPRLSRQRLSYDMGTMECARQVRALDIPEADRDTILGGHAAAIPGQKAPTRRTTVRRPGRPASLVGAPEMAHRNVSARGVRFGKKAGAGEAQMQVKARIETTIKISAGATF